MKKTQDNNLLSKAKYGIVSLLGILLFQQCLENNTFVTPSFIKVYVSEQEGTTLNILTFSAEPTIDNGMIVFGLCDKNAITTIFEEKGNLYVMKINEEGSLAWDTCLTQFNGGYPANFIKKQDNEYIGFWNFINGTASGFTLKTSTTGVTVESVTPIPTTTATCGSCNFIINATEDNEEDGFVIVGMGTDNIEGKILYTAALNEDFSSKTVLSKKQFSSEALRILSSDDLTIAKELFPYFHIIGNRDMDDNVIRDRNSYLFTGPSADVMALSYIGELSSIYQDRDYWINAMWPLSSTTAALVLTNPNVPGIPAYFVSSLSLKKDNTFASVELNYLSIQDGETEHALEDLDISSPVILKKIDNYWIVAGTDVSNQAALYIFDIQGIFIESIILGTGSSAYTLTDMVESHDGQRVIVSGFTRINFDAQRAFVVDLPKSELE